MTRIRLGKHLDTSLNTLRRKAQSGTLRVKALNRTYDFLWKSLWVAINHMASDMKMNNE